MDERAFVAAAEEANLDVLALLLARPTLEEERVLSLYLGAERYKRMRNYAVRRSLVRGPSGSRGNVVLLPGFMGSELVARDRAGGEEPLWILPLRIVYGQLERLKLSEDGRQDASDHYTIHASRVMQRYYGEVQLALAAANWNVKAFPYDWRKDLNQAADELNAQLSKWFDQDQPVHLIAHSMGGMVARTFIRNHEDRWKRMWDGPGHGKQGGRLIMLGVPNHGSFNVPRSIVGLEPIVRLLDHADIFHTREQLQQVLNGFPGVLQMMPSPLLPGRDALRTLYNASTYPDLNTSSRHLRDALTQHEALASVVDPERMIVVAGTNQPTWSDITNFDCLDSDDSYELTNYGDGRIPHELTLLTKDEEHVPSYFIDESHANLLANDRILFALSELLETGKTADLPASPTVQPWDERACKEARIGLRRELEEDEKRIEEIVNRIRARSGASRQAGADFVAELAQWRNGGAPAADQQATSQAIVLSPQISTDEGELADLITRDVLAQGNRTVRRKEAEAEPPRMRMEIDLVVADIGDFPERDLPVDVIAVGHYVGVVPQAAEKALDKVISGENGPGILSQFAQRGLVRGDLGQPFIFPDPRAPDQRLIILAGMGLPGRFGAPELTILARELVWTMAKLGKTHLATVLIGAGLGNLDHDVAISSWMRGIATALDPRSADLVVPTQTERMAPGAPSQPSMPMAGVRRVTFIQLQPDNALNMLRGLETIKPEIEQNHGITIEYIGPTENDLLKQVATHRRAQLKKLVDEAEAAEEAQSAGKPLARPARGSNAEVSTRITVGMIGNVYRFGAITASAAIPERDLSLDPALVMNANNELAAESNPDLQLERGIFLQGLLMPQEVRTHLQTSEPVVMMLDATTARIHWEMVAQPDPSITLASMQDGVVSAFRRDRKFDRDRFLGTSRGFTRQLRTPFAVLPDPPAAPRKTLRVLVVADPSEDMPLAGAEAEGLEVADVFTAYNRAGNDPASGNRVIVDRLLGPREATRTNTLRYLMLRSYDVLHFAGHCFYNSQQPDASGWIFSNGETISAHELSRIDRIPRFVFSNACESGVTPDRSELRSDALAPSFAESFFARGVANFICTAWPVDDSAARRFARTLYLNLLGLREDEDGAVRAGGEPQPMHVAMQRARVALAERASGARTWGAYQHYGNPNFRFFAVPGDRRDNDDADTFAESHRTRRAPSTSQSRGSNGAATAEDQPPARTARASRSRRTNEARKG
jgi:pimeloyl-ACP methyl ester carboxylesterase